MPAPGLGEAPGGDDGGRVRMKHVSPAGGAGSGEPLGTSHLPLLRGALTGRANALAPPRGTFPSPLPLPARPGEPVTPLRLTVS